MLTWTQISVTDASETAVAHIPGFGIVISNTVWGSGENGTPSTALCYIAMSDASAELFIDKHVIPEPERD